jgi:hypothetical protein
MLLFSLTNFEIQNESNSKFIDSLSNTLRVKVYENEKFDEFLDYPEYVVLKEITERLIEIKKKHSVTTDLELMVNYLERKIYNYSKLYAF